MYTGVKTYLLPNRPLTKQITIKRYKGQNKAKDRTG
jgi:hypothetical protein